MKRSVKGTRAARRSTAKLPEIRSAYGPVRRFIREHMVIAYVLITLGLMGAIYSMNEWAGQFKASILESQIRFDGTVLPVEKIPNWSKTGGRNDLPYSSYQSKDLMAIMAYNPDLLESDREDTATLNAQITYTVPYLGNYEFDHREEAGSHLAVDIRMPEGTPVRAVANGIIDRAQPDDNGGFGKFIVLKVPRAPTSGERTETLYVGYAHLSAVNVEAGELVKKGEIIGRSGQTGTATTPHLHFQIDRESAPWHPYWPFTSADASAAGLSFFEAINAGLGMDLAKKHTINPLLWVQAHLDGSVGADDLDPEEPEEEEKDISGKLQSFELETEETEVEAGDPISFRLIARDEEGDAMRSFDEIVMISSTDPDAELPEVLVKQGRANFTATALTPGTVKFTVKYGSVDASVRVTVRESALTEEETESGEFDHLEVSAAQEFVLLDERVRLTVTAVDETGNTLSNYAPRGGIPVDATNGRTEPDTLSKSDFVKGKAQLTFTGTQAGTAEVRFGDFGKTEIEVIGELKPVSGFRIETDGKFIPGVTEEITVETIDENGALTPLALYGTARITFLEGSGLVRTPELTSKDFENGRAKVAIVVTEGERARIKAQAGIVIGESDPLRAELGKVFADVAEGEQHAAAIKYLKEQGIVNGYPDGTFQPDRTLNRAEAAKLLIEGLKVPAASGSSKLKDVKPSDWFANYVITAEHRDIIDGYPDGTFKAANTLNMAEFFKILLEADDAPVPTEIGDEPCADVPVTEWFARYFFYAKYNSLLDFGKKCTPNKAITRGEVAEAMYRILN